MKLNRIDHFTIRTSDLEATRAFYEATLRLSIGWRPSFPSASTKGWGWRGSIDS
jgi:catechol 2,3-dioxygenase-like lactoylglutathione lyase family enzyme